MQNSYALILFLFAFLLLAGCGGKNTEDTKFVGVTNFSMFAATPKSVYDTNISRMQHKKDVANGLKNGDKYEIAYLDMRFAHVFEGFFEESTSHKGNELGLFISLKQGPGEDEQWDGDETVLFENRLIVSSHSRLAHQKGSKYNQLIYKGISNGGWLNFNIRVVEFDKENFNVAKLLAKNIYNEYANQTLGGTNAAMASKFLDVVGNSIYQTVTRDDLILDVTLRLVPVNYVEDDNKKQYFAQYGKLLITRVSKDSLYAGKKDIEWDKIAIKDDRIINGSGTKNDLSYILLDIIKTAKSAPPKHPKAEAKPSKEQ